MRIQAGPRPAGLLPESTQELRAEQLQGLQAVIDIIKTEGWTHTHIGNAGQNSYQYRSSTKLSNLTSVGVIKAPIGARWTFEGPVGVDHL